MNKILTLVLFGFSLQSIGQVSDSFTDGNFTSDPAWITDNAANWTVVNGQLRSNSTTASSSFYIATPSTKALNAQWDFFINLQFNTSGANFVDVYLMSNQANPATAGNSGYFVRIGGAPDEISLYKLTNGTASILINGVDGTTNSSNSNLRIKVKRDANNLWSLERDISGTGANFVTEGSAGDNTFTTCSFFCVRITQSTATFHQKHFFDDIYAGNIIVENIPPSLQNLVVDNANELTLTFSEPLLPQPAQQVANYVVNNGIGNPASAALLADQKTVKLSFATAFTNGVENQITISGMQDLVENTFTTTAQSFLYFVAQPANLNDLVINEIFADPSPQVGMPTSEFVEILNKSNKPFDLSNWKLSDPSSTGTLPSMILLPNQYVIITTSSSVSSYSSFGKTIGASNFPTLNNSGDALTLLDDTGKKIDSMNYSLSWYQDEDKAEGGWTLERLNPNINTNEPTNWQASVDVTGGTPGRQNSVFGKNPDSKPPVLESVQVLSQLQLRLLFNEILSTSATTTGNYSVNNNIETPSLVELSEDKKSVVLTFAKAFPNGVDLSIRIIAIADEAGNIMPTIDQSFRYFNPQPAKFKDVLFTEIMADPSPVVQLPEAEYLELYNRSDGPLDLANWQLFDGAGATSLPSQIILAGEYLILTSTSNAAKFTRYGKVLGVPSFPSLNNAGEPIALRTLTGLLVDSVNYTVDWYRDDEKKDGGWSLEIIDTSNDCGEDDNWIASERDQGGTPGSISSVDANKPDLTAPKLLSLATENANQLQLLFNEKLETNLTSAQFVITPSSDISSVVFTDRSLRSLTVTVTRPFLTRTLYSISLKNLRDCSGNAIAENTSLEFALPEAVEVNDVAINEILFNPKVGGVDFVELYNQSEKFLNMKQWQLANTLNGALNNQSAIKDVNYLFRPKTFLVLTSDAAALAAQHPAGAQTQFIKTSMPSLPDDEGSVALTFNDLVIDSLSYSARWHNPLIKDDEGVSLERISLGVAASEPSNWTSATAQVGFATPGLPNSTARPVTTIDENQVSISPQTFDPAIGFAQIMYRFDQPNFVATVKILDLQGRLVKEIANNETVGYEGFFRWDGDQQDGSRARMGYYTVWVEIFDLNGAVSRFKKRVVVFSN